MNPADDGPARTALQLVLGGGAVLGHGHVGVLSALPDAGLRIDAVSDTSAGAVVAAMYAFGMALAEMRAWLTARREGAAAEV